MLWSAAASLLPDINAAYLLWVVEVVLIFLDAPASLRYALKKNYGIIWEFFPYRGGGLPNSQNFCKLTKYFFVCQIHSEVLKHVLQRGGW